MPDAANVFPMTSLQIAKQDDGSFYWPALSINTIGNVDITEGYKVFLQSDDTWVVEGMYVPASTEYSLFTNQWNWMGYPFATEEIDPQVALANMSDELLIVQNDDGEYWWPALSIQTMDVMVPGTGYKIFVENDVTFTYATGAARTNNAINLETPVDAPAATGLPYAVVVDLSDGHDGCPAGSRRTL